MAISMNERIYRDPYAFDLSKNICTKTDIYDYSAINQSIENILTTSYGERPFNIYFGSVLPTVLFDNVNENNADNLLTDIIKSIELWEDRITILKEQCSIEIYPDNNYMILNIVYVIKKTKIKTKFTRKIF